jgi:hypothetical protein
LRGDAQPAIGPTHAALEHNLDAQFPAHAAYLERLGPELPRAVAIIQEVYNDEGAGAHGLLYKSPASPGFGVYKP